MSHTSLSLPPIAVLDESAALLVEQAGDDRRRVNAVNKAILTLHTGVTIMPTTGGFLVESRTRPGLVHRVSTVSGCSCEAGQASKACWHAATVAIIEQAQTRAIPLAIARTQRSESTLIAASELYA
jgi:hypothetical protein